MPGEGRTCHQRRGEGSQGEGQRRGGGEEEVMEEKRGELDGEGGAGGCRDGASPGFQRQGQEQKWGRVERLKGGNRRKGER